jgi:hypothetical protein
MTFVKTAFRAITISAFMAAFMSIAHAQATRTWVSGVGDDLNPCSRTAPCKTFAGAISKTAVNGEINCLDPAGYGAVTITKSITIDCEDTQGSILASGVNGVVVNITSATDTKKAVKLRGISINGAGTGINGIRMLAANLLVVEEVVVDGFTQHGISVETTSGNPKVVVDSSAFRSNTGNGINTFITAGNVTLIANNSRFSANATGFNLSNNTDAVLSNSFVTGNTTGVVAFNAEVSVSHSVIQSNTTGISSLTSGLVRLSSSVVTLNNTGLSASGGSIVSYSSNMLNGNTADGSPTSTVLLQ